MIPEEQLAQLPPRARDELLKAQSFKMEDISTGAVISWKEGCTLWKCVWMDWMLG